MSWKKRLKKNDIKLEFVGEIEDGIGTGALHSPQGEGGPPLGGGWGVVATPRAEHECECDWQVAALTHSTKKEELEKKFYAISEKIYKAAAEAQQAAGADANANGGNADNVYEADFKDADEDKK